MKNNSLYVRISHFLFFLQYYYGRQIKEDEINKTCRTHGEGEMCIQIISWKYLTKLSSWEISMST
jgi:hypothetical protein